MPLHADRPLLLPGTVGYLARPAQRSSSDTDTALRPGGLTENDR